MNQEAVAPGLKVVCALCATGDDPHGFNGVGGYPLCRTCLETTSNGLNVPRRRFYKITEGKQIAGVCGGLADYSNMDRDTLRVLAIVGAAVTGGVLVVAYLVLAFLLPTEP